MRATLPLLLVLCSGLTAGCASTEEPSAETASAQARECFRAQDANSFSAVDDRAVNVGVGARRYFRLELAGACPDVDWTLSAALRTRGSSWICRGHDADLVVAGPLGAQSCPVRAVRRLTDEEVAEFHRRR